MADKILGYSIYCENITTFLNEVFISLNSNNKKKVWLACINPHSYYLALSDKLFKKALNSSDWLVPDGIGIVYASYFLRGNIRNRITGSDIFYGLNDMMDCKGGKSVFFLGSTKDNLDTLSALFKRDYPNIRLAGVYSPPFVLNFNDEENNKIIEIINNAKVDVLWVGLSAPKQEKWIVENLPLLEVNFVAAIGAVFDFYTGKIRRSNKFFQTLGLEWLPRLIQEPKRLWKRMFISAPVFIWHVLLKLFKLY